MTLSLNDELLHYGVPGMKWGRRKARQAKEYVKSSVDSKKREYSWNKQVRNRSNLSYNALKKASTRLQRENELKANTRGFTQLKGKKVYRNRAKLSDQNLKRVTERYKMENKFQRDYKKLMKDNGKNLDKNLDYARKAATTASNINKARKRAKTAAMIASRVTI